MLILIILAVVNNPADVLEVLGVQFCSELGQHREVVDNPSLIVGVVRGMILENVVESQCMDSKVLIWVCSLGNHPHNIHLQIEDSVAICFRAFWEYHHRHETSVAQKSSVLSHFFYRVVNVWLVLTDNLWEFDANRVENHLDIPQNSKSDFAIFPFFNDYSFGEDWGVFHEEPKPFGKARLVANIQIRSGLLDLKRALLEFHEIKVLVISMHSLGKVVKRTRIKNHSEKHAISEPLELPNHIRNQHHVFQKCEEMVHANNHDQRGKPHADQYKRHELSGIDSPAFVFFLWDMRCERIDTA